ncbi:MAG: DEAD/DEAH box helicase family protein [Bacilli bacterium]|nr:DEAD/DEAH box helicase family protein [Bacilli bacterium]
MKRSKRYQENAIKKIFTFASNMIDDDEVEKIVLHAPTGAGKTFIMAKCIERFSKEIDDELCFVWVSVGKGNLHEQSYISVKNEISNIITCSLAEKTFFGGRDSIYENEIVFVNWDKLNNKNSAGEWTNFLMKDREGFNFPEILDNTRGKKRKIVLIIDESHYGAESERSLEIIYDIIRPNLIIEMSATPKTLHPNGYVYINPRDVKEEQMIKNDVIINKDLEEVYSISSDLDSTRLTLETAYKKRLELKELYERNSSNVNPLVLIQIPNRDSGNDKRQIIENFLYEKGINYTNGKLYAWLDQDDKSHVLLQDRMKLIVPFDSKVEFLIFKQAIDTGWDCPRAQVLVKFRETKSTIFSTQTLGRILRMPEAKHYPDDALNTAYVYTNIEKEKMKIEKETCEGVVIKNDYSKRKSIYEPINLLSYHRNRPNQGDIEKEYYRFFERSFIKYFDLTSGDGLDYKENILNVVKKGINIDPSIKTALLSNGVIPGDAVDNIKANEIVYDNLFGIKTSSDDLQYKFISIISSVLNGFPPARSIPTVRQAIFMAFKKLLNITLSRGGAIYIQSLIVGNDEIFSKILDDSIKDYKEFKLVNIDSFSQNIESYNESWNIEERIYYNPDNNIIYNASKSLHQPLYLKKNGDDGKVDQLEVDFINYLEEHGEFINWFFKNGDESKSTNFGIRKLDGYVFRPDFIVSFKNGAIGIFDTKAVGYMEDDTKIKAEALYKYVTDERYKGKNIVGAIVIKDNDKFRINMNEVYNSYATNYDEWEHFDQLF